MMGFGVEELNGIALAEALSYDDNNDDDDDELHRL